jgi:DNA-binding NarL/FixJ family response regulator
VERTGCDVLVAMAAHCRGAVALAEGRASESLIDLRRALAFWNELEAPYEIARVRALVGLACRALGDADSAALETEAAGRTFAELGARPDLARLEALGRTRASEESHGLTDRERQVLRLVAAGKSNREIAGELFISEHTVARHIQNIFAKVAVSSRTAATAFAFAHGLA